MLEGAFSFRGRIGRLNYFLGSLLMLPAGLVAAVAIFLLMAGAKHTLASAAFFAILVALILIVGAWYSLSLYVRRIRDLGWSPFAVIAGWLVVNALDAVVAAKVPSLAVHGHGLHGAQAVHGTYIVHLFNLVLSAMLLFWPGRDWDGELAETVFGGDAGLARPTRLEMLGVPAAPAPAPRIGGPVPAPVGFGRRGRRRVGVRLQVPGPAGECRQSPEISAAGGGMAPAVRRRTRLWPPRNGGVRRHRPVR